jgi:hypothetical protein
LSSIDLPTVSVIVPSYQRAQYLPHLFASIGMQVYPADRLEMIVIDNSSTDNTEAVVADWAKEMPFPVRFKRKKNDGPAASRNLGAYLARGEVLAYTDSDCIPDSKWLANAIHRLQHGADLVAGPIIGLRRLSDNLSQQKQTLGDNGTYPTGNVIVWRRWFDAIGGFDEQFGIYPWGGLVAGEDTDFAWRARHAGANVQWDTEVRVGHQIAPEPTAVQRFLRPVVLQIFPRLIRTIPELRDRRLWHRYFIDKEHFKVDLALSGLLLARLTRKRAPLGLALPWIFTIARPLRTTWRIGGFSVSAKYVASKVHAGLGDAAVLTFASARYRRVVL